MRPEILKRDIKALAFDQYGTIVDMQKGLTEAVTPFLKRKAWDGSPHSFVTWWRRTHFENSMIDALCDRGHTPYRQIGQRAVSYVMDRCGIAYTQDEVHWLVGEIEKLKPFPDVTAALGKLRATGYKLAILSNGDRDMLRAGWYSALAQGQGLSLLCRAQRATGDDRYLDAAHAAFGAMTVPTVEGGVLIRDGADGAWLEEAVVDPPTHILNGFLWATWGVRDYGVAGHAHTRAAWALLDACRRTLARNLPTFDCGFWSLYEQSGTHLPMLASPFYHGLHVNQLAITARLLDEPELASWSERWNGYARRAWYRRRAFAQKALFKLLYY